MKEIINRKLYVGVLLILFTLFSKINSEKKDFSIEKFENYNQETENNNLYAKIEVKGNDIDINYVLSAYSSEERKKRIQLAQSINGITKLYLSPKQKNEKMFITLECSKYPCKGSIEFSYLERIDLMEGESLSYFVSGENEEMEFSLIPNKTSNSQMLNIWARGQKNINTILDIANATKRDNYYIVDHPINKTNFKVTGKSGDFINVGFIGYTKDKTKNSEKFYNSNTNITVDENIITAFLKKGTVDRVCYQMQTRKCIDKIEVLFGSGIVFTKIAYSFKIYKNGTNVDQQSENNLFPLGIIANFIYSNEIYEQNICFSFPPKDPYAQFDEIKEIILTYQVTRGISSNKGLNLYEPQLNGVFYPRYLKRNHKISFIPQNDGNFNKMTFNLMSMSGFPKMSIVDCDNYPLCDLDKNKTSLNKINSSNINRFSSLSYNKKSDVDYSPISKTQKLMIVECQEGEKKENKPQYFDKICGFGTLMNKEESKIELIEDQYFNQFAPKNQKDNYKIKIAGESKVQNIFIDIMSYVGDVNVTTNFPSEIKYNQYTSINKIYLSVKLTKKVKELNFVVTSISNSYYTILVNYGRGEYVEADSFITNELQTGLTYLVTIDPNIDDIYNFSNKVIKYKNDRYIDKMPIMFNFYSLNCEVEVKNIVSSENEIKKFRHFSHIIIEPNNTMHSTEFEYRLLVKENSTKICKVYTSAIELTNEHEKNSRDILIPDNTPQQIMFSKEHRHVSFGYVHVDFKNDLLIKFDPQHIAQYTIKLYYENVERNKSETIVNDDILYLSYEKEWKNRCKDSSRVCYIQLDITLKNTDFSKNPNPVLDFSIKSVASNFVSYLPRNTLIKDYIHNNISQYYYTELNCYEEGFITINFLRGSGNVYGKLVSKNNNEENPNWRGKYKLPSSQELEIASLNQKLKFRTNCGDEDKEYFLLLNVFSDVQTDFNNKNLIFPFTLSLYSRQDGDSFTNTPLISIPLDEYVVGIVDNKNIIQFYSVWLNSDAEEVIIQLQSVKAELLINVGNTKPINKGHFKIPKGGDIIYSISKKQILEYAGNYSSIKDLNLTIRVWANNTDYQDTSPFSFIVRLGGKGNNIYRVNSEQKALCKAKKVGNRNRCLYLVEYDYLSNNNSNSLFIYANVEKKSTTSLYAKYINKIDYEINKQKLEEDILTKENSNFTCNGEYLYIKKGLPKDKYLLVLVEIDNDSIVELVSLYNLNLNGVTANPITSQMFLLKANSTFSLNFPNNYIMVNLRNIMGSGEIHLESDKDNKYFLKGIDDRLSMINDKLGSNNKLLIKSKSNIQDGIGLVFYANYIIKSNNYNLEPFALNKLENFVYTNSDFPITLYAPINSTSSNPNKFYEISINFNILENEIKKELTYYGNKAFIMISGYITSKETVHYIKKPDITINKRPISGFYDQALKTGIIRFSKDVIYSETDHPYLVLQIKKTQNCQRNYKKISFITTTMQDDSNNPVSEIYQFGSLEKEEISRKFNLRVDKSYNYIILQFSSTEDKLSVKVNDLELKIISDDYGKKMYYIETKELKNKLIILQIERNKNNTSTEYFMFKYTYSNKTDKVYTIKDSTLRVKEKEGNNNSDYFITFKPIDNYEKYNITYIIRIGGIRNNKNETLNIPKKEYISMHKDKSIIKEFYNPKLSGNELILNITQTNSFGSYIQVMAKINDKENIEYLSYKISNLSNITNKQTKDDESQDKNKKENNQIPKSSETKGFLNQWISENTIPFIIIVSILGCILILTIILVLIVFIYHKKTKNLMNNINNVSFKNERLVENNNDDEDGILK